MVDDGDYEWLNKWKWFAHKRENRFYVVRGVFSNGVRSSVYMHRQILNPELKEVSDHIDGNGLNNQRKNLRSCSQALNLRNTKKRTNGKTSKFKGVCSDLRGAVPRYRANIRLDGKQVQIGSFDTEVEAAMAYNLEAQKHFGSFARVNDV